MIKSMTGFGAAEGDVGALRISVEARSVNHRFFNPTLKLPGALSHLEGELREALKARVARGHVTLAIWARDESDSGLGIDEERVARYAAELKALQQRLGLAGEVELKTLLKLPQVFADNRRDSLPDLPADVILPLADEAIRRLQEMRAEEGDALERILRAHLELLAAALDRISRRAPVRLQEQHVRLSEAVQALVGKAGADPARIAQEVAIISERLDIAEEVNRFRAHLDAFRKSLDSGDPAGVGKRLGFILQEMLRETNTIGSKGADTAILAEVVSLKEELERMREQVENVE